MRIITKYGPPDIFVTEYFRVHESSRLDPRILRSITENPSGKPIFAQLIGEDIPHLARIAKELHNYPIAGVDINLGCPAPKVYRKNVGGGLLRDPNKVDMILGVLRETCSLPFTVKMRIGFEDVRHFNELLQIINKHSIDLLSVHVRTVKEMYRGAVHYDTIKQAVETVSCPVMANGNITSVAKAQQVIEQTGAAGVMLGRSAIRNPWLFLQLRQHFSNQDVFQPTLADVRQYIEDLWNVFYNPNKPNNRLVSYMKKFLNFVGQGVDPNGDFLKDMRHSRDENQLFTICDKHLILNGRNKQAFAAEPYDKVIARPNCED